MYDDYLFDLVLERQPTEQDRFGNSYSCRLKLHIVSPLQFFFSFQTRDQVFRRYDSGPYNSFNWSTTY